MDTETTIKHLGGLARLMAMLNARDFMLQQGDKLRFRFSGSGKANVACISLSDSDTYTVELWRVASGKCGLVGFQDNIYAEQLRETFEDMTGLALTI